MPEMTIRLEVDPDTGRKRVRVAYESDADALPMEHEQEHRALVNKLLEDGLIDDPDQVVVDREEGREIAPEAPQSEPPQRKAQAEQG